MITNLFSIFDPCNFYFGSSWVTPLIIIFSSLTVLISKTNTLIRKIKNYLSIEFKTLTDRKIRNNFLIPLFITILFANLISIIPSTFIITAQISFVLPIALAIWFTNLFYFIYKKTNRFFIHLVPIGSPTPLIPIIVLIELIRNLIRPITLSVRLVANITAGHLLIHLLRTFICSSIKSTFILIPVSIILNVLELGVAFIQRYIICTLIALYSNEIH